MSEASGDTRTAVNYLNRSEAKVSELANNLADVLADRNYYKAKWEEAQATIARLTVALVNIVEHFDSDFSNPGLEIYGLVTSHDGSELSAGGQSLNRYLDDARAALAKPATGAPPSASTAPSASEAHTQPPALPD